MKVVEAPVCFHCAAPLPAGASWRTEVGGVSRAMCCPGCAAIARTIEAAGMAGYYLARDRPAVTPPPGAAAATVIPLAAGAAADQSPADQSPADRNARDWRVADETQFAASLFDDPAFQAAFVHPPGQAHLLVQGLRCGACAWLIETALARLPGVQSVTVNLASTHMLLAWDGRPDGLSSAIHYLRALGYDAVPWDLQQMTGSSAPRDRREWAELLVAGLGMMQVMMYTLPLYLASPDEITGGQLRLMQWAGAALTLPVLFFSARSILRGAWLAARARHLSMDQPIALGLLAAFAGSLHSMVVGSGPIWFDSIAMLVFFLLSARWIERAVRRQAAVQTAQLARPLPARAERVASHRHPAGSCSVNSLQIGDRIRVAVGAVIPVDGQVVFGAGPVAEALLTGESTPVWRTSGDPVLAASLNLGQVLEIEVTALARDSVLARLRTRMEEALGARAPLARLADRAARHFVAGLLLCGVLTGAWWAWHDPQHLLPVLVALLVVSCPCALALAVPATLAASSARLAGLGVLVLRGHGLETLAQVRTVVFDKTGTLTQGAANVTAHWLTKDAQERGQATAALRALESGQGHPLAHALLAWCAAQTDGAAATEGWDWIRVHPGLGVSGRRAGVDWQVGSADFLAGAGVALPGNAPDVTAGASEAAPAAASRVWLAQGQRVVVRFDCDDPIRADVASVAGDAASAGHARAAAER